MGVVIGLVGVIVIITIVCIFVYKRNTCCGGDDGKSKLKKQRPVKKEDIRRKYSSDENENRPETSSKVSLRWSVKHDRNNH